MIIFKETNSFLKWRNEQTNNKSIGLVPTMGNLHEGHLSLVSMAAKENEIVIISIFVNPKQFGPGEDLEKYPRTFDQDYTLLKFLSLKNPNCEFVIYAPKNTHEVYEGFTKEIIVDHPMTNVLCGAHRPGHFDGVTTVVYRLFSLTRPVQAYFGEKDYQQLTIIKEMVKQEGLTLSIKSGAIVRSIDGLALSSRNQYLSSEERERSLILSRSINLVKESLLVSYEQAIEKLNQIITNDSNFQYLEVLDADDLSSIKKTTNNILIAGAYFLGSTRIIDNSVIQI